MCKLYTKLCHLLINKKKVPLFKNITKLFLDARYGQNLFKSLKCANICLPIQHTIISNKVFTSALCLQDEDGQSKLNYRFLLSIYFFFILVCKYLVPLLVNTM